MALVFNHPFTLTIAGPTSSGKTHWVKKLVKNIDTLIKPTPQEVVWCYGEYQNSYIEMQTWPNFTFCEGFPDLEVLKSNKSVRKLLIIDDLMHAKKQDKLSEIYTKASHHWNLSVINLVQNLFYGGLRTSRINSHYLCLLKNPSDQLAISTLAKQLYPKNSKHFIEAYTNATLQPYSYLLVDLHQLTDESFRLRTKVFPGELQVVYVAK